MKHAIQRTAILFILAGMQMLAQSPGNHFVSIDRAPYGPGDRSLDVSIKLLGGETTANIEVWVLYSENAGNLNGAKISSSVPHGRAKLGAVNSEAVVRATFIFPHTDFPKPNVTDRNEVKIRSGRNVFYKVIKKNGATQIESEVVDFTMPDKLTIANFGDSYASGEGAPYRTGGKWDNDLCHRSGNAGQALAVKQMKADNPGLAIAFKNVACSGAEIAEGLLQPQKKSRWLFENEVHQQPVPPQVDQVADWLEENGYDDLNIAMISAGGNDVGFGNYIADYHIMPGNFATDTEAGRFLEETVDGTIPNSYTGLKSVMEQLFDYDEVLVSEYPDPLRDKNGAFCNGSTLNYGFCWIPDMLNSPREEYQGMYNSFLMRINNKIKSSISSFDNWSFVSGAMAASKNNGICNCDNPYFNTGVASFAGQGDIYGIVHPNRNGHRNIYKPLYETALRKAILKIRVKWAKEEARERAKAKLVAAKQKAKQKKLVRIQSKQSASSRLQGLTIVASKYRQKATGLDAETRRKMMDGVSKIQQVGGADNRMSDDKE